jgi:hypothetical protein
LDAEYEEEKEISIASFSVKNGEKRFPGPQGVEQRKSKHAWCGTTAANGFLSGLKTEDGQCISF